MLKNKGRIIKLSDGRRCIVNNTQPLLEEKKKIILHLVDEDNNPLKDENGKSKILIKTVEDFNNDLKILIGFVD